MNPELKRQVLRNSTLVRREGNLMIYQLETRICHEDPVGKVRVLSVGHKTEKELKSVLLLGETGNGKTLFLNTFLNMIFGVGVDDDFRLQLKDRIDTEDKSSTQSQTEYTSIYTIYHQEGMPHAYNYKVIDTPGFGDTEGEGRDEANERSLRFCLTSEEWVHQLNCVGLVWKSSDYRYDARKKEILAKVKQLLSFDMKGILDVLLTFSTNESTDALRVIEESGITFRGIFPFDNIHVFRSLPEEIRPATLYRLQFQDMEEKHSTFIESLNATRSISLQSTAEFFRRQDELDRTIGDLEALRIYETEVQEAIASYDDGEEEIIAVYTVQLNEIEEEICTASGRCGELKDRIEWLQFGD